jgi:hypothetical protein
MALTILYWVIGIIMQSLLLSRNMYAVRVFLHPALDLLDGAVLISSASRR